MSTKKIFRTGFGIRSNGLAKVLSISVCSVMVGFQAPVALADYTGNSKAQGFIGEMVKKHGFERGALEQMFAQVERQDKVLESIAKPAEKVLTWADYRRIFMTQERTEGGKDFLREHKATLERAHSEYGVPPEIVVAILGVETKYGRIKGSYRVIDALSTLAFDYPPRAKFFRAELEQFLLLTREQNFDPTTLAGSYAGAMGYGQFIPSSFRRFAVDFDGDKVEDIWNNPVDAIGSVANYFKQKGWKEGGAIATPVRVEGEKYRKLLHADLKPVHTVAELKKAGVKFDQSFGDQQVGRLMELEGPDGREYWVGFHNFYVITRYNISHLYAMAVHQLSREILHEPSTPQP